MVCVCVWKGERERDELKWEEKNIKSDVRLKHVVSQRRICPPSISFLRAKSPSSIGYNAYVELVQRKRKDPRKKYKKENRRVQRDFHSVGGKVFSLANFMAEQVYCYFIIAPSAVLIRRSWSRLKAWE